MDNELNTLTDPDFLGKDKPVEIVVPDAHIEPVPDVQAHEIDPFYLTNDLLWHIRNTGGLFPQLPKGAVYYLKQEDAFLPDPSVKVTQEDPWLGTGLGARVANGARCTQCDNTRAVPIYLVGAKTGIRVISEKRCLCVMYLTRHQIKSRNPTQGARLEANRSVCV